MITIFIGPPFAGKDTQASLLSKKLSLPLFSMGGLIRDARKSGDKTISDAYKKYTLNGLHIPINIKFGLLKIKLDNLNDGFILSNFPATLEDLNVFNKYLTERNLSVDKVFYLSISKDVMQERFKGSLRKRPDDDSKIISERREVQDNDRIPVIEYFKKLGILVEINGERDIKVVYEDILGCLEKVAI